MKRGGSCDIGQLCPSLTSQYKRDQYSLYVNLGRVDTNKSVIVMHLLNLYLV
jgi:hypothetical protein